MVGKPIKQEITVEVAGELHTGSAELVAGLVIVTTAYGRRSTKIGDRDFILLARLMLGEIVREEIRKRLTTERPRRR
jgi:hypothetical protein